MTEREFDHGYWYATELRAFARDLGVPGAAKLRKDELEHAVRHFLRTREVADVAPRAVEKSGRRDVDEGLALDLPVRHYIISDFTAANRGATREQAIAAWNALKQIDAPKTYQAWASAAGDPDGS